MHVEARVAPGKSFAGHINENNEPTPQPYGFLHGGFASQPQFDAPLLQCAGFDVWCASSASSRSRSAALCRRMYASRGYSHGPDGAHPVEPLTVALQARRGDAVLGTLTVRFDSVQGLAADTVYGSEIDAYRRTGASVCELTRLAVANERGSRPMLPTLFHVAYLFFGVLAGATDVFIEINPRHEKFYERMLGFARKGECRTCTRVQAPAVLMHRETTHIAREISAAQQRQHSSVHSWYGYSLSQEQEAKVLSEVIAAHARQNSPTFSSHSVGHRASLAQTPLRVGCEDAHMS